MLIDEKIPKITSNTFRLSLLVISISIVVCSFAGNNANCYDFVNCDNDSDCFLIPEIPDVEKVPALIYLSCTGGKPEYIDSVQQVYDSLGWAIAVCYGSRNHRSGALNEYDILNLVKKLIATNKIDPDRIAIYGFSGQGVQAWGTSLRNPEIFSGIITSCAHAGGISHFWPERSKKQKFYIISRDEDWNLEHNQIFHQTMDKNGIDNKLVITPGEHGIGSHIEVFEGCKWLDSIWQQNLYKF